MCWLTAELGLHVLTLDLQGCSTSGCPGKKEGSKGRAQKKLENMGYHWQQSGKISWWQESSSVQQTTDLTEQARHGQHGQEVCNASVFWPGERHKPRLSAQLDWTPRNAHCACAPGPLLPISSAFSCSQQRFFLPRPFGALPDKQNLFAFSSPLRCCLFPCLPL